MSRHPAETSSADVTREGGQILVDHLRSHGVDTVFCVPGESYLPILDALHDTDVTVVSSRHEGGAAMMAEAQGKLTGRPGVAMVTRGPGACNASAGVHIAQHDGTPMILLVGQVAQEVRGRGGFQEVDYTAMFGQLAKWVVEVDDATRLPEVLSRAWQCAVTGRPGPVVVSLPEDVLTQRASVVDAVFIEAPVLAPDPERLLRVQQRLCEAQRPVVVVGGTGWDDASVADLKAVAAELQIPVVVSFRRQMLFPADHACFIGDLGIGPNPEMLQYVTSSDCVLAIGARLGEMPSQGYTAFAIPGDGQQLCVVYPDAEELGRVYASQDSLVSHPGPFLSALRASLQSNEQRVPENTMQQRAERCHQLHNSYLAWSEPPEQVVGDFQMGRVMRFLRERLSDDAILCNGAGNYASWVHRYYRFKQLGTQLAPTSGSMGYGLPAAIAAAVHAPEKTVVAFAGDGCFQMTCNELATAVQQRLRLVVVVIDNGMYGTIRMHQEMRYPHRVCATELENPDFAAVAVACGALGAHAKTFETFCTAFDAALAHDGPAVIHCHLNPEVITPTRTLSQLQS